MIVMINPTKSFIGLAHVSSFILSVTKLFALLKYFQSFWIITEVK